MYLFCSPVKAFTQLISIAVLTFFLVMSGAKAADEHFVIAVVDVRLLLQKAPQSDEASRVLKERFLPQEKALDDEALAIKQLEEELAKDQNTLTKEEIIARERDIRQRKRKRNRDLEDYREDLRLERNTALDDVQRQVFDAIEMVRAAKKIDVVIQDYVAVNPDVDITNDVLKLLGKLLKESQQQEAEAATAK